MIAGLFKITTTLRLFQYRYVCNIFIFISMLALFGTAAARNRTTECQKFEGKFISFHSDIYLVKNCRRQRITSTEEINSALRRNREIIEVDATTIRIIPEGQAHTAQRNLRCSELNGHYVTFSFTDIYYVENCRKRLIPDWATFLEHSNKRPKKRTQIRSLSIEQFRSLRTSTPIPSVLDNQLTDILSGKAGVDVLPISEACQGIEDHVVSYYSKLYKIENCRKRAIDPELFSFRYKGKLPEIKELTSEQWLSLPDGAPIQ